MNRRMWTSARTPNDYIRTSLATFSKCLRLLHEPNFGWAASDAELVALTVELHTRRCRRRKPPSPLGGLC